MDNVSGEIRLDGISFSKPFPLDEWDPHRVIPQARPVPPQIIATISKNPKDTSEK
ncbi:MAG TPA: hypothetical protein VNA15_09185 [Candidatus Angelobacter sp.]|nr:hypothetical protein [Candidatus Angelobacter sp.]